MTDTLPPPPPNPDDGSRGGRPRKLTPGLIDAASALLQTGLPETQVARRLLVGRRTWATWKALGRQYPEGLYGTFQRTLVAAREEFFVQACKSVADGMGHDPWLALAVLERRNPKVWGKYGGELGELRRRIKELEGLLGEAAGQEAP